MRPSVQQPYAGIFVINQFNKLAQMEGKYSVELFSMERTFTGIAGSIIKYFIAVLRFIPFLFRKYDIVHVHYFYPFVALAVLYKSFHRNAMVVATFHGTDITVRIRYSLSRSIYARLARKADFLIAVSNEIAREIENKLSIRPHLVMCAGVDSGVFFKKNNIEKKYDFIFAASFSHRKGADILIEAIRLVGEKNIRYCIAGTGIYRDEFYKLKADFNLDVLAGQNQNQLCELFNASRFLILPSRNEPFGLVVTEAMYCGTPVIVSHRGGLKEQVTENINGFFLYENTPEELAEKIISVMNLSMDEYQKLSLHALNSNKQFSLDEICRSTIGIYKNLLRPDKKNSNTEHFAFGTK